MNPKLLIRKFVSDRDGNIVIFQSPNLPIICWFVTLVISYLLSGSLRTGFSNLSTAFLFVWAYLEITDGASYLRRFVGVIVMSVIIVGFLI